MGPETAKESEHKKMPIANYPLDKLLSDSVSSSPAVSIRTNDSVSEATSLLPHHLESFTDSLVVTENDQPVGMIGGIEILDGVLKNPRSEFFDNTKVGQIMNKDLAIITAKTTLSELLNRWMQTRRAFAIMPNQYHGYSVISARKLLEIGAACNTKIKISGLSKKIITFGKNDTVRQIITSMFENKTRKLILKGTSFFVSDRIIIQKIARELSFLRKIDNFLEMKGEVFKLDEAKKVSDDLTIDQACKVMYDMQSPYLIVKNQVISPWDIVLSLSSENITS